MIQSERKDGGPAFPKTREAAIDSRSAGMSLRDYFAAQALPSLILACGRDTLDGGETLESHVAKLAYELADALLKARSEKEE